jgi:hypothetical protein
MAQKRAKLLMSSSLPRFGEATLLALLNLKSVTIHAHGSRSENILWAWWKAPAIPRLERPIDLSYKRATVDRTDQTGLKRRSGKLGFAVVVSLGRITAFPSIWIREGGICGN